MSLTIIPSEQVERERQEAAANAALNAPDTTDFDNACALFRQTCLAIGEIIGNANFKGGYDEVLQLSAEQFALVRNAGLTDKFNTLDSLCNYEAQKLGIGRPDWWYICWGVNRAEQNA